MIFGTGLNVLSNGPSLKGKVSVVIVLETDGSVADRIHGGDDPFRHRSSDELEAIGVASCADEINFKNSRVVHRSTHHHSPLARSSKVTSYALRFLDDHQLAPAASEVPILVHLVARE